MEKEIKCPNCGGSRYTAVSETSVKCAYCGTVFKIKEDKPEPPKQPASAQPQPQEKIVIVQQHSPFEEKLMRHLAEKDNERQSCFSGCGKIGCGIICVILILFFIIAC